MLQLINPSQKMSSHYFYCRKVDMLQTILIKVKVFTVFKNQIAISIHLDSRISEVTENDISQTRYQQFSKCVIVLYYIKMSTF